MEHRALILSDKVQADMDAELAELRRAKGAKFNPKFIPENWPSFDDLVREYEFEEQKAAPFTSMAPRSNATKSPSRRKQTAKQNGALTEREESLLKMVAQAVGEILKEDILPRLAELEAYAPEFTGPYTAGRSYRRNQSCSHQGSTWICTRNLPTTPSTPNSGWKLSAKRGRDGRDAPK